MVHADRPRFRAITQLENGAKKSHFRQKIDKIISNNTVELGWKIIFQIFMRLFSSFLTAV